MNEMYEVKRNTLSVLVENTPGVLSQIARFFSRKGYNIESLASGPTDDPEVTRITIEIMGTAPQMQQIINQLQKLFCVYSVRYLDPDHSIRRELVMIKVLAEERSDRTEVIQLADIFRATILDVSPTTLTLAVIGEESKTKALEDLMARFGILELVRTGVVALERGQYTIRDQRKEITEFNLGKHAL